MDAAAKVLAETNAQMMADTSKIIPGKPHG